MDETSLFLTALYGDDLGGQHFYLWSAQTKRSAFLPRLQDASTYAATHQDVDLYFGVGLLPSPKGTYDRAKASEISAIPGLWADLDVAGPGHQKQNLPTSTEDALSIFQDLPPFLQPSIVIQSGGGLHTYWPFHEPWLFEDDAERADAAKIARAWVQTLTAASARRGWTLDQVGDLARIMRLPGSRNQKYGAPCTILQMDAARRWSVDEFEPYLAEVEPPDLYDAGEEGSILAGVLLHPEAAPPADKLDILLEDSKARASWMRKRKDLLDQSLSSYDMSLATLAFAYGWTPGEVASLVIAFRRRHGKTDAERRKALRVSYLRKTLANARARALENYPDLHNESLLTAVAKETERTKHEAVEQRRSGVTAEQGSTPQTPEQPGADASPSPAAPAKADAKSERADDDVQIPESVKEMSREALSRVMRVPVLAVQKLVSRGSAAHYRLVTADRTVDIGGMEVLNSETKFQVFAAEHFGLSLPKLKKWRNFVQCLLNIREEIDLGEDTTEAAMLRGYLQRYMQGQAIGSDVASCVDQRLPFHIGREVFFPFEGLRDFIRAQNSSLEMTKLARLVRDVGCMPVTKGYVKPDGTRTTTRCRAVPKDLLPEGLLFDAPNLYAMPSGKDQATGSDDA